MMTSTSRHEAATFVARLAQARASGRALLDLTEPDPGRSGLAWDAAELEEILRAARGPQEAASARGLLHAREAVSSYLAGRGTSVAPERVLLTASRGETLRLLVKTLCEAGDEVLVPTPGDPTFGGIAARESVRAAAYRLAFDGAWRLDRKSVSRAVTHRTRAIFVGNPSDPTGALLSRDDVAFLEGVCAERGLALVGDETFADTALGPWSTVAGVRRCVAFHVSGLSGICGLPHVGVEWLAAAGPDALVEPVSARLERVASEKPSPARLDAALPALLARRERFLATLRVRLAGNRSALAAAALREAPWALEGGEGSCWAVLDVGAAQEEAALCLALLEDGVAVQPGSLYGFPASGYVVVSLLPTPDVFGEGLSRLDRRLRAPLVA